MGTAFAVAAGVILVANMAVRARGASWLAVGLKTLCGVCFCVLGIAGVVHIWSGEARVRQLGILILAGLVLGLLGDVALAVKDLVNDRYELWFLAGFGFFALGHLAYITAMVRGWMTPFPWVPILVCAVLAASYVGFSKTLKLDFGRMAGVVGVYSFLVLMLPAMGFFAMATGIGPSQAILQAGGTISQPAVVAAAGLAFLVSDLILAWTYFGPGKDKGWENVVCYVFYYAAQFGIAASLFKVL